MKDLDALNKAAAAALTARGELGQLIKSRPDAVAWQRDLVTSHNRVGDVLSKQGKLDEGLQAYSAGLQAITVLTRRDENNNDWQHDRVVSLERVAGVLAAQEKIVDAVRFYRESVSIRQRRFAPAGQNEAWSNEWTSVMTIIGGLSYRMVFARQYSEALELADYTIALVPTWKWTYPNRAHALMLLGRRQEAEAVYLLYKGTDIGPSQSWNATVLGDFRKMRQEGISDPLMDEVERELQRPG